MNTDMKLFICQYNPTEFIWVQAQRNTAKVIKLLTFKIKNLINLTNIANHTRQGEVVVLIQKPS